MPKLSSERRRAQPTHPLTPVQARWGISVAGPENLGLPTRAGSRFHRQGRLRGMKIRFATDSPLEGSGFELPVPRCALIANRAALVAPPAGGVGHLTRATWLTVTGGPKVRIHLSPALGQQTFGSSKDGARCSRRQEEQPPSSRCGAWRHHLPIPASATSGAKIGITIETGRARAAASRSQQVPPPSRRDGGERNAF